MMRERLLRGQYLFDGVKTIALSNEAELDWLTGDGRSGEYGERLTVPQAYRLVPYLYRGVDLRARALSGMPWALYRERDGLEIGADRAYRGLLRGMRMRLYLTEAALCLYGAAYWLKEHNGMGGNMTPRWLLPASITPHYDERQGLAGFDRASGQSYRFAVRDMVYFWLPNLHAEVGPGLPPARVALAAAGVLWNLDLFAQGFFQRGAIKMTLLTVEGNPNRQELDRLEIWWRRMVSGVRRAWETVAIRSSVKPVVIGDGLKDTVNETLTVQRREDVCAALGVPHSLISADAANYATSQTDYLNFYVNTVVPQALLVEEVLNEQLFADLGLRWRFQPEKLEVFQQAEMQKGQAVARLVGKPIMTINEGRAWMGLPPLPGGDVLKDGDGDETRRPEIIRAAR